MRVVYLSAVGQVGGAERVLLSMIEAMRSRADVHLIALADGPLLSSAEQRGATTHLVKIPDQLAGLGDSAVSAAGEGERRRRAWFRLLRTGLLALPRGVHFARRLARKVDALHPDLVHSNGNKTHVLLRLAGLRGVPTVWHLHDFLTRRRVMSRLLRSKAVPTSALAVSHAVADDAAAIIPESKIRVLYNTVDTDCFAPGPPAGAELDRLANLPPAGESVVRVGLVGTFARWKGQDVFLRAAGMLAAERGALPPIRCYIIGGPIYSTAGSQFSLPQLRQMAIERGAADSVGFIGFQEDVAQVYRNLDIVVHASTLPEPFGLTIVEAMACGRAVIVARAGGAQELFTDGQDAIGVAPGEPDALAAAIRSLAEDAMKRDRLGRNARQTIIERFSNTQLGGALSEIYESVAEPGASRGSLPLRERSTHGCCY